MTYVEGFITPVPTANRAAYLAHAHNAADMIKEFGATRFVECWGDDVPRGTTTDFWGAVQATDDETVLFSWFEYPDKATRDAAGERMMNDPRMADMMKDMPFDAGRMIYAGFEGVVEEGGGGRPGYVDGFVAPVADTKREAFIATAAKSAAIFREHGASRVVESWGDDVSAGETTDYARAVKAAEGETVIYSWIEWPDKATRDAAWPKLMEDPRMPSPDEMAFDGKRMFWGGFEVILDA